MRILVVGGAGYIGSVCAELLLDEGHAVAIFDNLSEGHRRAVDSRAEFFEGDLANAEQIRSALTAFKPESVMHFAASALVAESMENPSKYFRNNIGNGLNLLDAMVATGVKRIVFSSTCATFGPPERVPIDESLPQRPINPYGESKLAFEKILRWFDEIHGLRFVALRYFNAAGASECIRDYIHILDLARAHLLALQTPKSEFYNLGTGGGMSVREVIESCREITGHQIPVVEKPRRAGDPPRLIAASEKIQRELGWRPQFQNIDTIIESAWKWHQKFPNGYGD
ncbi:MAG: UDP-glucose 4-epimerase [Verrucomicrobiaceae bacterium]|nr:UDP-glucose 4-epimerase [Verrucomicrobiaceae bacterium]